MTRALYFKSSKAIHALCDGQISIYVIISLSSPPVQLFYYYLYTIIY